MLVAVYGSLKRGFGNFHVMEEAGGNFLSEAISVGDDYIMNGQGFPYVIHSNHKDNGKITVELFEVEDIKPLDWLEGHPSFYKRVEEEFETKEGVIKAWVYIYQGEITPNPTLKENKIYTWRES